MASWLFFIAWSIPVIWARKLSEMIRPAGSSAAGLIRIPVESRTIDLASMSPAWLTLRSAFIALTLVLIRKDISVWSPFSGSCVALFNPLNSAHWYTSQGSFHATLPGLPSKITWIYAYLRGFVRSQQLDLGNSGVEIRGEKSRGRGGRLERSGVQCAERALK